MMTFGLYESTNEIIAGGFSNNPWRSYIEVWGYLQAIVISQDSLKELYWSITGEKLDTAPYNYWREARDYRIEIAGHPINRKNRFRSFFGRGRHDIKRFKYERFDGQKSVSSDAMAPVEHPEVNLADLCSHYFEEDGADALRKIITHIDENIRSCEKTHLPSLGTVPASNKDPQ